MAPGTIRPAVKLVALLLPGVLCCHADSGAKIVEAARKQVGVTTLYDPAYITLAYPNGDVPADRGVCTDVLVRALRTGLAIDLQQIVHRAVPQPHGSRSPASSRG